MSNNVLQEKIPDFASTRNVAHWGKKKNKKINKQK